jgi:hypothetical protein
MHRLDTSERRNQIRLRVLICRQRVRQNRAAYRAVEAERLLKEPAAAREAEPLAAVNQPPASSVGLEYWMLEAVSRFERQPPASIAETGGRRLVAESLRAIWTYGQQRK